MSTKRQKLQRTITLIAQGILTAPPAFCAATMDELKAICNGCGSASAKFDFVPDTIWGVYIGEACMIHDFEYHAGRTEQDKATADWNFLKNLIKVIRHKSKWYSPTFVMCCRAMVYYYLVSKHGSSAFWAGKTHV